MEEAFKCDRDILKKMEKELPCYAEMKAQYNNRPGRRPREYYEKVLALYKTFIQMPRANAEEEKSPPELERIPSPQKAHEEITVIQSL